MSLTREGGGLRRGLLTMVAVLGSSAQAQDVVLQNDSFDSGESAIVQAGFVAGEIGAAVFTPTAAQVQFPVKLKSVQIAWLSLSGATGETLGGAIHIYHGGLPNPTEVCIIAEDCALLGPVLSDGALNEYILDPDDPFVVEGITQDIILNGPTFMVGYEFEENPNPSNGPSLVTDVDGCQGPGFPNILSPNTKNAVRVNSGAWHNLCGYGVSGDLIIRARVEHVNLNPPTLMSVMPTSANNGGPANVTVNGANFISSTTVKLTRSGQPDVTGSIVNLASEQQLTCTFNLTGAAVGLWNVVVTTDNGTAQLTNAFNVTAAPNPSLAAFTPNTPQANCGPLACGVFGSNLQNGATIKAVQAGSPDIPATNYNYQSTSFIGFTLDVGGAPNGPYNIVLTNPNGAQATLNNGLNVSACQPSIFALEPANGLNNGVVFIEALAGANFVDGPNADTTVQLTHAGQAAIPGMSVMVFNGTHISCTFDITAALVGFWNVVVTNPNGGTATLPGGFEVIPGPPPEPFFMNPSAADNCATLAAAQVFGFDFYTVGNTGVRLTMAGQDDVVGMDVVVDNPNQITVDFDLTGVAPGTWGLVVTNPDGQEGTLADAITISQCIGMVTIVSANPPTHNPFTGIGVFRDVLDTGAGPTLTAGIGGAGTSPQGSISYDSISVTFSAAPSPPPSAGNIVVSCTGGDCPTVTGVSGNGVGPYAITLDHPIPPGHCTTLNFAGGGRLQYQSQPGNVSMDGLTNTQDLLALIQSLNNGTANSGDNVARYNLNRSTGVNPVNTQDLLRLVQLLNGTNTTQPFNGAGVAACP